MDADQVKIESSWREALRSTFESTQFDQLSMAIKQEIKAGKTIYPPGDRIFNAFDLCPFDRVKAVILGQDPYHGPGQAMGLSFSVPKGVRIPPSLVNIFKELQRDLNVPIADHGDLTYWAQQGILLLNAVLTVEARKPASHRKIGWMLFTDEVIRKLSNTRQNLVFMLWGNFAKAKKTLIDGNKHLILEAAHPSPLAGNKFQGCQHFSRCNNYLTSNNKKRIDWNLQNEIE